MDHVRIMCDLYWLRMTLELNHHDGTGGLVNEGEHRLSEPDYLPSIQGRVRNEPLRYEKVMIDRWLQRELGSRR